MSIVCYPMQTTCRTFVLNSNMCKLLYFHHSCNEDLQLLIICLFSFSCTLHYITHFLHHKYLCYAYSFLPIPLTHHSSSKHSQIATIPSHWLWGETKGWLHLGRSLHIFHILIPYISSCTPLRWLTQKHREIQNIFIHLFLVHHLVLPCTQEILPFHQPQHLIYRHASMCCYICLWLVLLRDWVLWITYNLFNFMNYACVNGLHQYYEYYHVFMVWCMCHLVSWFKRDKII